MLTDATDVTEDELRQRLLAIDKTKVDSLLNKLGKTMPQAQHRLLKAELDAVAKKTVGTRFYATAVR